MEICWFRGRALRATCLATLLGLSRLISLPAEADMERARPKIGLLVAATKSVEIDNLLLSAATDAFFFSGRFDVVELRQLEAVFSENDLREFLGGDQESDLSRALRLDFLGIVEATERVILASDGSTKNHWILDVRLIDTETAIVASSVSSEWHRRDVPFESPRAAGEALFVSIREAFPAVGHVVELNGVELVVDLGEEDGLRAGDVLEVVGGEREIIINATGETLRAPPAVVGEVSVISTAPFTALCKLVSQKTRFALWNAVRLKRGASYATAQAVGSTEGTTVVRRSASLDIGSEDQGKGLREAPAHDL